MSCCRLDRTIHVKMHCFPTAEERYRYNRPHILAKQYAQSSRSLEVRDTRKLVASLAELGEFSGLPRVHWVYLAIPLWRDVFFDERLESHWPVAVALCVLKAPLLDCELLLRSSRDGKIARVDDESCAVAFWRDIVVRCAGVPCWEGQA